MGKTLPPDQLALYKRIDEILWEDWDPIGVVAFGDAARDEYQSYLPSIFAWRSNGATSSRSQTVCI
jgi:hypothetical protein